MSLSSSVGTVAVLFACLSYTVLLYNLDTEFPVVKKGPKDSYFGFSFAFHDDGSSIWAIVGAPRANNSQLQYIYQPGVVYRCALDHSKDVCEGFLPLEDQLLQPEDPEDVGSPLEILDNMWMGVSVASAGVKQNILACAHRYITTGPARNYHLYEGVCYVYSNKFSVAKTLNPCNLYHKVSNKQFSHEEFAVCQAGTSVQVNPPEPDKYYLFAPGSYRFRGSIFSYTARTDSFSPYHYNNYTQDTYLGYSSTLGYFKDRSSISVAAGGPRHNHEGTVFVVQQQLATENPTSFLAQLPKDSDGVQLGAGFGFSVASGDFDANSFDDLAVGAPFETFEKQVQQGSVYVYRNKGDAKFELARVLRVKNSKNFGSSVAGIGDINLDSFDDLAVGSPYEDEGIGVLYIYLGSPKGIQDTSQQRITGRSLGIGLLLFGSKLTGRFDADRNGYPDVLVGAFKSSQVVLLRSRPILSLEANITFSPSSVSTDSQTGSCIVEMDPSTSVKTTCFQVQVCAAYLEKSGIMKSVVGFSVTLEADTISPPRALFKSNFKNSLTFQMDLSPKGTCLRFDALVNPANRNVYPDIRFRFAGTLHDISITRKDSSEVVSLSQRPVLNKDLSEVSEFLKIQRDCIKPSCIPDLHLRGPSVQNISFGASDTFKMELENVGVDPAYSLNLYAVLPPGTVYSGNTKKHVCKVTHLEMNTTLVSCLELAAVVRPGDMLDFGLVLSVTQLSVLNSSLQMVINVTSMNSEDDSTMGDNVLRVSLVIKSDVDLSVSGVSRPVSVLYGGKVIGESSVKRDVEIGPEVVHTYYVANNGPDNLPKALVTIYWPYEAPSGKHLLYLMDFQASQGKCNSSVQVINPLNLQMSRIAGEELKTTSRREVTSSPPPPKSLAGQLQTSQAQRIKLDCAVARCVVFSCLVKDLKKGDSATFVLRARFWNSTVALDFGGDFITVHSRADVQPIVDTLNVVDTRAGNNMDEASIELMPQVSETPVVIQVKSWPVIVGVLVGLLLLVLVLLCCWKIGFFRRMTLDREQRKSLLRKEPRSSSSSSYKA